MPKVGPFDVFQHMVTNDNKALTLAPLNNVLRMLKTKKGDQIVIGAEPGTMLKIYNGQVVGGLILCEKTEFNRVKAQLEAERG